MKTAIILYFLMALCSFRTSTADKVSTLQAATSRLKNTAQTTVNDLTRFESSFPSELNVKLSNLKIASLTNVNSIVNPAVQKIQVIVRLLAQDAVNAANSQGKQVDSCYDSGKAALKTLSLTAFSNLDTCASTSRATINPVLNTITNTIAVGNQIISNLDSIFPNCFSSNVSTMVSCIVSALPSVNSAVTSLQTAASSVKNTANQATTNALSAACSCNSTPVNNVSQGTTTVIQQANQCIANA